MERDAGIAGRLLGLGVIDGCIPPLWEARPEDFPLCGEVLDLATGLIVHSHYVEQGVRSRGYEGPIWHVPHPAWPAPDVEPERVDGAPLIGAFGNLNPSKRVPQLLDALERLRETHPNARLLLVGAGAGFRSRLADRARGTAGRGAAARVRRTTTFVVADGRCRRRRVAARADDGRDVGTTIRALTLGKPLVVSDVGWFSELPDDVAVKVAPDADEVDNLAAAVIRASEEAAVRGAAARQLAETEHDVARVADLCVAALEESLGGDEVREDVLREVVHAAAEVGIDGAAGEAGEVGRALDEIEI